MNKATRSRRGAETEISPTEWEEALTSIIEDLRSLEYPKMLELLNNIPRSEKSVKSRAQMTQIIIKYYGVEKSISVIRDVMDRIPRRDPVVQDLLRPFLDKLKNKETEEIERKRKKDAEGMMDKQAKDILETEWTAAMREIFPLLEKPQYKRMLEILDLLPPQRMSDSFKDSLPQRIIEKFGLEGSIIKIQEVMAEIPRKDPEVQVLLEPFLDQLKKRQVDEQMKMSSEWTEAMKKIFPLLEKRQNMKMLEILDIPPPQRVSSNFKVTLPQKILEKFGLEGSITKIQEAMEVIPRRDPDVQLLLQPFLDQLKER